MQKKAVMAMVFALLSAIMLDSALRGVTVSAQLPVHNVNTGLDYSAIQAAIDAPETLNGHTIEVDPGTYRENVMATKSLVILGRQGPAVTVVDASDAAGPAFDVLANSVTIMNFSLTGGSMKSPDYYGAGIYLRGVTDCFIGKNVIYGNDGHGVYFESSHYNDVYNNTVRNNAGHGFHVFYGSHHDMIRHNIIAENGGNGLYVWGSYNNITDNVIHLNQQYGMTYRDSIYDIVENNRVTSNLWIGSQLILSDYCTIRNNTISASGQWGLRLGSSDNNNIIGNILKANEYGGIIIDSFAATPPGDPSHNNVVNDNTFTMNEYGVRIDSDYQHYSNMLYHNNFIDNSIAQAIDPWANTWDDGYPSGGNYWDDYTGVDRHSGANQDRPGSDGIGDTPYIIDVDSKDTYPLMFPFGTPSYTWPMRGRDPACTGYSPSDAPDANATLWVSNMPGGTAWAYPLVAEGKVFIGAGGYLNAYNEADGGFLWNFRASAQPGYPSTSAVADGIVFFGTAEPGPGGCIYALDATTGGQIWNFTTEGYVRAPPVVSENRLYIGGDLDSTGKLYCINATTGASIWNYTTQDRMTSVAVAYGKVYASCGHWETDSQAAVYCLDMYDGSYVWNFDTLRDIAGYLAIANGKVYFTASYEGYNCVVYALNASNGDVVWSTTRYSNGNAGAIAVAYGKVFIALGYYLDGIYALNETNGDEIWAFPTVSGPGGGPVVADGKVFFSGGYPSHMFYAVNETNGAVIWSYQFPGDVHSSSSAIANGIVFVADHWYAKLYAFWSYKTAINAYCYTETTAVSVSITKNGSPTGYETPHTFTNPNGAHTFTVPDTDPSGHRFVRWNDGSTSTTITVSSSGTYTAYYSTTYILTIEKTYGGTTSPSAGTYTYLAGEVCYISATPSINSDFDHWVLDGSDIGSANPIMIIMDNNYTLKAVFWPRGPVGGSSGGRLFPLQR